MQHEYHLSTKQAAEYLNLSPRTLEGYRCTGGGPRFCKLSRRIVYRQSDLDAWVAANLCHSTSEYGRSAPDKPLNAWSLDSLTQEQS